MGHIHTRHEYSTLVTYRCHHHSRTANFGLVAHLLCGATNSDCIGLSVGAPTGVTTCAQVPKRWRHLHITYDHQRSEDYQDETTSVPAALDIFLSTSFSVFLQIAIPPTPTPFREKRVEMRVIPKWRRLPGTGGVRHYNRTFHLPIPPPC